MTKSTRHEANIRKTLGRAEDKAASAEALHAQTKLALQQCILVSGERNDTLYVPEGAIAGAEKALNNNFSLHSDETKLRPERDEFYVSEHEGMQVMGKFVNLPDYIANPIKDGIKTGKINFANTIELGKDDSVEMALDEILNARARGK